MMARRILFSEKLIAPQSRRMREWKGRFDGKRCFCVGNGPSLRSTPLHMLKNEYTFGLNRVAEIYPYTTWRPTFYVNVTVGVADEGWAGSARVAMANTPSFIGYGGLVYILGMQNGGLIVPLNVFPVFVTRNQDCQEDPATWSHDVSERVSKYGSSMLAVMQIAVYLGFTELIMVGCDCKWVSFDYEEDKDPNHFIESYWGKMKLEDKEIVVTPETAQMYTDDARSCHVLAKKVCDKLDVEIYNATIGGELEIYPRVDFMEIV